MYRWRLCITLSLSCVLPTQAHTVSCEHGAIQETLELDHLEPLSCASYSDLIASVSVAPRSLPSQEARISEEWVVARLVSCAHGTNYTHYVDAHLLHTALFDNQIPTPEHAPKILFNPINGLPLTENITYFALSKNQATYVGTLTDVYTRTAAGEYMQAFLDAHHTIDSTERAYAQCALADCYHAGAGVACNNNVALHWYTAALEHAADAALRQYVWYALGSVYHALPTMPDYATKALAYYTQAAESTADTQIQGAALIALGNWYMHDDHNGVKARSYYTQALACDDSVITKRAHSALADLYRIGSDTIAKNYARAATHYKQALALPSRELDDHIRYSLATLYFQGGFGITKDYAQSAPLFQAVTQSQNTPLGTSAAVALGELYRSGGYGVLADAAQSRNWYNVVVEKAPTSAHARMAHLGLAELYRAGGKGLTQDRVKAHALYTQLLASCADGDCLQPMINNGLASLYCVSCTSIAADHVKAESYYQNAFNQTRDTLARTVAAHGLATLYYHDAVTHDQDVEKAVPYYAIVAQQSDDMYVQAHAHQLLGTLYWHGQGNVSSNLDVAIEHLQCAAQQEINPQAHQVAQAALQEIHRQSLRTADRVHRALKS